MQFRQNGQRDERRRRVLRDELLTSPAAGDGQTQDSAGGNPDAKVPSRGYSAAVSVESQPPISCLIATRPWTLTVLVLAGLTVIAGLEAAYSNVVHGSGLRTEITAALDVTARGSLGAWFSSLLLSMAAVNAVLLYWLRSHKLDDYRGRYRVWLWTALGLVIAAVDVSTRLHAILGHVIADRFESPVLSNATVNGVIVLSLVFGGLAVRLGFEIWSSRLARSSSIVAAIGFLAAILIRLDVLFIDSVMLTAMAESTALLVANLAVAFTVAAYCRYVHLESQGALKPRRERPRKQPVVSDGAEAKKTSAKQSTAKQSAAELSRGSSDRSPEQVAPKKTLRTETINSKTIRCDAPHQSQGEARPTNATPDSKRPAARSAQPVAANAESDDDDGFSDFDPETGETLSKSERRRLRKQMRRQKKTGSGQVND